MYGLGAPAPLGGRDAQGKHRARGRRIHNDSINSDEGATKSGKEPWQRGRSRPGGEPKIAGPKDNRQKGTAGPDQTTSKKQRGPAQGPADPNGLRDKKGTSASVRPSPVRAAKAKHRVSDPGPIRHEVSFKTVTHKICSDTCFNVYRMANGLIMKKKNKPKKKIQQKRYRMANGLIMNCCEQCGDYLPSRATANHALLVDGQQKRFCCLNCIKEFKQVNSKLSSCASCKTLIKTGEVLHGVGATGVMGSFYAEPTCHFCKRNSFPQYQATLPEGDVLNFCSSPCVTKFQNAAFETVTNGQTTVGTATNNIQLKCNYCRGGFSVKPEILEWEVNSKLSSCASCKTLIKTGEVLHGVGATGNAAFETVTNGQTTVGTATNSIQLKCNYCRGGFSVKPEILEWEDKVYQFCRKSCCEDYKKLHCIVTFCENCQEEKTLHDTLNVSGVKRPFCSEGDFIRRLGLKCVSCNHCGQLCKRSVTRQLGGITRDFCGEPCAKKFHDWYHKAARCDCCRVQGSLTESVHWRSEMKHFCDQQCLLRFYMQQNQPIMVTQKGPENITFGVFYVRPGPGGADDTLWFSTEPLDRSVLESLITRVLVVREVYPDPHQLPLLAEGNGAGTMAPKPAGETLGTKPLRLRTVVPMRRLMTVKEEQHLYAKGRNEDLFGDPRYRPFGEELDRILAGWQPSLLLDGSAWGRVEEESLWRSRQLGDHSPTSLLLSLVYLNTKHLGLRSLDQHLRLSFTDVYGPDDRHPVTKEVAVCVRVPSLSQELP
ncbi:hypothetical protein CRUP_026979, partial [Coryphaenoides rupestris]